MFIRFAVVFAVFLSALQLGVTTSPRRAFAQATNACGCFRDDKGACKCTKKSKCGCPEECEPMGCEEKRQKQADREADAALKKMESRERKKGAEAAKQAKSATRTKSSATKVKGPGQD